MLLSSLMFASIHIDLQMQFNHNGEKKGRSKKGSLDNIELTSRKSNHSVYMAGNRREQSWAITITHSLNNKNTTFSIEKCFLIFFIVFVVVVVVFGWCCCCTSQSLFFEIRCQFQFGLLCFWLQTGCERCVRVCVCFFWSNVISLAGFLFERMRR